MVIPDCVYRPAQSLGGGLEHERSRMKEKSLKSASRMAPWRRRTTAGLLVHSDIGSPYANKVDRRLLKVHHFVGSMSCKRDCWDKAVAESFFASLQKERVQWNLPDYCRGTPRYFGLHCHVL